MGMSRCYSLMTCLLVLFSIVFLIVGGCSCGFAGWMLWDEHGGVGTDEGGGEKQGAGARRAGLCAIAAWGALLALGALVAMFGAARSSASLLAAAFALLALAAVAEVAAAWWGAAHLPQLHEALQQHLRQTVVHDYGIITARTHFIDTIQQGLECCGAESTHDWQGSAWSRAQGDAAAAAAEQPAAAARATNTLDLSILAPTEYYYVPDSCCIKEDEVGDESDRSGSCSRRVPVASSTVSGLHAAACGPLVVAQLSRLARAPLAIGGALLALHALALMLALALCLRARPAQRYKA